MLYHWIYGIRRSRNECGCRGNIPAIWPAVWKNTGWIGFAIIIIVLLAIPQIMYFKNKDTYWLAAHDWGKIQRG